MIKLFKLLGIFSIGIINSISYTLNLLIYILLQLLISLLNPRFGINVGHHDLVLNVFYFVVYVDHLFVLELLVLD